ncbi:helix-turn-helix domain-containing protein [Vibrio parahaemolyticus]|uniref:helix-turn-helix domain-containing protein n=1 Tax=Vibrio parahaemolyticus TaxID=670 RepID=UPI00111F1D12|nr:helix-turn-helix domain-containing protein [Vibrio parahaemolyticus]EJG1668939.1 helix-turn-helix domain-containing protein [Vibrio parahaemolyticus]EJG1776923.1 helix-turn-helix domain-containing protein [Vibrio parahaemolyticus]TOJ19258.1 transcriptional regulator [Vibrio parahaemolyticus]TOJ53882.1 transcriptional regulator [Vibrio parahaemolyticus]
MTTNEQVLLQSILAKIDRVERVVLEQRLQQQKVELLGKDILTVDECAALLGLSTNQLYKLTSSAEIPYFKLGKHLRFERQAIMDWVEQMRVSSRYEIEKRAANYVATTSLK